jgi:hypothetical protein
MTRLSTGVRGHTFQVSQYTWIPFTMYLDVVLFGTGNRWEKIREIEEYANKVEDLMVDYSDNDGFTAGTIIEVSRPVKFTRQFGNSPLRLTINGNIRKDATEVNKVPLAETTVINASVPLTGYDGSDAASKDPTDYYDALAVELKGIFEGETSSSVIKIDLAGIIYGNGGRSIQ